MRKALRCTLFVLAGLVVLAAVCGGLFFASKSRTFQFFGRIVSSVPNDRNLIALTFDDGPTENTGAILETLDRLDIKATFFLCGAAIADRPDDARAIAAAGHAIGNHSYSHRRMVLKTMGFIEDEIDRTNALIRESGYGGEIFFRPPYGKKLFALPLFLERAGMVTAMWSIEPETVLGFDASAAEIADYVIAHAESGSIILLHPMYNPDAVCAALDILVPALEARGYVFATLPDLYAAR